MCKKRKSLEEVSSPRVTRNKSSLENNSSLVAKKPRLTEHLNDENLVRSTVTRSVRKSLRESNKGLDKQMPANPFAKKQENPDSGMTKVMFYSTSICTVNAALIEATGSLTIIRERLAC